MTKNIVRIFLMLFLSSWLHTYGQENTDTLNNVIPRKAPLSKDAWVDSVFQSLSPQERIGQLFMIRAHSNKNKAYHEAVADEIRNNKVGGVCFFQGGPIRQINLVNYYQSISKTPLFVAIDGEWGISMRLDSVDKYPRQMTLGAIEDDSLIYQMGQQVAEQCKMVGVNINFAPVVDVNNNPKNPVINSRSFGEQPERVAVKALAYMQGMQHQNVLAVAKHFPGHGDTDSDSHKTLPTVHASWQEIDSVHLPPFRALIKHKVGGVMVAHLFIPALDSTQGQASSLSPKVVNGLLKDSLGFQGLAITDALEMKGVANYNKPGALEVKALLAGNDILLMPNDLSLAIKAIQEAIDSGEVRQDYVDAKIKKILAYKYDLGLSQRTTLSTENIYQRLNAPANQALIKELYRESITLIRNNKDILPLDVDLNKKVAVVTIGFGADNAFSRKVGQYRKADRFHLDARSNMDKVKQLVDKVSSYDVVIVALTKTSNSARRNYGIYQSSIDFVNLLAQHTRVVLDVHANPYSINRFTDGTAADAILLTYQDNNIALEAAAEAIFGGSDIKGKMPVTAGPDLPAGYGLRLKKNRINFGLPEEKGINSDTLSYIDSVALEGINAGAYPGCQIMVVKDGMVIYDKSFGKFTYEGNQTVTDSNIYDLASITKVLATTLAVMHLESEGKIDVDKRLKDYLPELDSTNKGKLVIRDVMSHQARLTPWIPFYLSTLDKEKNPDSRLYSKEPKAGYSTKVADDLYILDSYRDSIFEAIVASNMLRRKKYRYSDLGFIMLKEIIERISGTTLDRYVDSVFYRPMGLQKIAYNPLQRMNREEIVPTENDAYFRHQLIQGYVHDQAAAMMGGVSGHAGLFSNSLDVAILAQMLLNKGTYGTMEFLDSNEIEDFTRQQFPLNHNRRGLGFDKPLPNPINGGPTCEYASYMSYGHSGFTGTYFWVDPKYNLVYVFLSNRVYPDAENWKLIKMDIRTRIQEVIYKAIGAEKR
jgi:beta-glucosidase-like glycosyl hydrolase/CubicO group peptidase (beta-lactamase class C family)